MRYWINIFDGTYSDLATMDPCYSQDEAVQQLLDYGYEPPAAYIHTICVSGNAGVVEDLRPLCEETQRNRREELEHERLESMAEIFV